MDRTELYLKTAFCCMACDGDIAPQEIALITSHPVFEQAECLPKVNEYAQQLKKEGVRFLQHYLDELKASNLTEEEEMQLVNIAVQIIEADRTIEYSEIAFFKKIRHQLKSTDSVLIKSIPANPALATEISPEDYLQPDISDKIEIGFYDDLVSNIALPNIEQTR